MSIQTVLGQKISQTQMFLENGVRIPVTNINVEGNVVVGIRTQDKDNYSAVALGFGKKKNPSKATLGNVKTSKLSYAPSVIRESKINATGDMPVLGDIVKATAILEVGDIVDVIGTSKGKGYAGVVKRHHFKGGPRTHGQSDRERAPGSIGQTTTPGRVYKGKRMAGHMGHERVTVENLLVMSVDDNHVLVKGLIPGSVKSFVTLKKVGKKSKFVPLYKEPAKEEKPSEETTQTQQTASKPIEEPKNQAIEEPKKGEENAK